MTTSKHSNQLEDNMVNIKLAIGIVYALVAIVTATKITLHAMGIAPITDTLDIIELAAAILVVAAFPINALASAVKRAIARRRWNRAQMKDMPTRDSRLDSVEDEVNDLSCTVANIESTVNDLQTVDDFELVIPVISTIDSNYGKVITLYELPPVRSIQAARAQARLSIEAREREGLPVSNPVVSYRFADRV